MSNESFSDDMHICIARMLAKECRNKLCRCSSNELGCGIYTYVSYSSCSACATSASIRSRHPATAEWLEQRFVLILQPDLTWWHLFLWSLPVTMASPDSDGNLKTPVSIVWLRRPHKILLNSIAARTWAP